MAEGGDLSQLLMRKRRNWIKCPAATITLLPRARKWQCIEQIDFSSNSNGRHYLAQQLHHSASVVEANRF